MTIITELSDDSTEIITDINDERYVHQFCRQMVKGTIFVGTFHEKRFVDSLNAYRSLIKIDDSEKQFIQNVIAVQKKCCNTCLRKIWIGITDPNTIGAPAGYNLWVSLDQEVYGTYWYKVRNVHFSDDEICFKLETIRSAEREPTPNRDEISFEEMWNEVKEGFRENSRLLLINIYKNLTFENIKATTIFIFLLVSTLLTFSINAIHYLMEYIIKFIYAVSRLVESATPICETLIRAVTQAITQIIGGFYILVAHMWQGSRRPKVPQQEYLDYRQNYQIRGIAPPPLRQRRY